MRMHYFAASVLTGVMFAPWAAPAVAQDHSRHAASTAKAMACCDNHEAMAQQTMPCCAGHTPAAPQAMACCTANDAAVAVAALGLAAKPATQTLAVTFRDPVRVGHVILMGRHVIEHDDARMARGEPCTYIYDANDRRQPVVVFHCTHLERPEATSATVVLRSASDSPIKELKEFQFTGETASHGVPAIR